jgi:hypothetical protein
VVGNPARAVGFACRCGQRLNDARLEGHDLEGTCPSCGPVGARHKVAETHRS